MPAICLAEREFPKESIRIATGIDYTVAPEGKDRKEQAEGQKKREHTVQNFNQTNQV